MAVVTFDRVLVPLEFQPVASDHPDAVEVGGHVIAVPPSMRRCLELGASLVGTGTLRLLHATPSLTDSSNYGSPEGTWIPDESLRELDARAQRAALKVLGDLGGRYAPDAHLELRAIPGAPTDVILEQAAHFSPDVIVLATSGRGRAKRFILGSTADKVIRQANCPVMVVPNHDHD